MSARRRGRAPWSGRRPSHPARLRALLALASAAATLAAPQVARAQDAVGVAGRTTVQLGAGVLADPASPLLEIGVGHFVGDLVEIGVRQEGGFATGGGPRDWHLATTPFLDVHLFRDPKPRWSPFLGVVAGALYDDRGAAATVGPEAGVRLMLGESAFVAARYQFRWASEDVGGVGRDAHVVLLGVGVLLGTGEAAEAAELARIEAAAARAEEAATRAEESVARLELATERLERAVDEFAVWFEEQLKKR